MSRHLILLLFLAGCGGGETVEAQCRRLAREAFPVDAELADAGHPAGQARIAQEVLRCVGGRRPA